LNVAIIGGGISGLATAFYLKQHGISATLVEKSPRLGGLIRTDSVHGCQLEAGPDSYIATKPAVTQLAAELGNLNDEIIGSNDGQRRVYIVRQNRFLEMPTGMVMMIPGDLNAAMKSPLFSRETKLRFVTEIFFRPRKRVTDISVEELVVSHFGEELLEYVTEPLLSGVYGGDAAKLSAESVLPRFIVYEGDYGSLIRAVRRERSSPKHSGSMFLSFRGGMQSLIDSIAAAIAGSVTVVHEQASGLERTSGGWRVTCAGQSLEATHVVLAAPAYTATDLLTTSAPELAAELAQIRYSSAILVTFVYREQDAAVPSGFGFLVPRGERHTIAAATFIGTKWPSRIAEGFVAIRSFIVDPEAPELLARSDEVLIELVRSDFKRLLNIDADPAFSTIDRWPNSMPQYVVGHKARQERIKDMLLHIPGLYLTGNAYDGVGVPDCVRLAAQTAHTIASSTVPS
jgi:oxygen-dependent protoporphyrinogen oxidase